ncbi:MAG: hypothetical protein HYS27_21215 [Deltaproteobacteria bacterium]|nr:hypothetical protein [Deltaproteobacteria bacterium]
MRKTMIAGLKLLCPPISNQEAQWSIDDQDFRAYMKASGLYFITRRRELFFSNWHYDKATAVVSVDVTLEAHTARLSFELSKLVENENGLHFFAGPKVFRLSRDKEGTDVVHSCTPDVLLWQAYRGELAVAGFTLPSPFLTFDLLYVGISKKEDAFTRLVANAHETRIKILTDLFPLREGARVSDEVHFMFFEVSEISSDVFADDDNVEAMVQRMLNPSGPSREQLIADVEKAFVSVLKTKYNTIKYAHYPKGVHGLGSLNLDAFAYVIDEDITFTVGDASMRGAFGALPNATTTPRGPVDAIVVDGGKVTLARQEEQSS